MAAATHQEKPKWEGKATTCIKTVMAEQIWPLWTDFCGIDKWFPNLARSNLVEGTAAAGNEVGAVRYNVGDQVVEEGQEVTWAKERLLEIDNEKRVMRYEVLENTLGLKGYVATIRVYDEEDGCVVEWRYEAEEVEAGWDGFQAFVESALDFIVKKMEDFVRSQTKTLGGDSSHP